MQFGGVIYGDAADKATRFIANCNIIKNITGFSTRRYGFMVGSTVRAVLELPSYGAKMVNAVANSVVPKFTIIIGNSFRLSKLRHVWKSF